MGRINKSMLGIALVTALGLATTSLAGPGFKRFDTNGDGKLDDAERAQLEQRREKRRQKALEKFDANKDGTIDDAERQAAKKARAEERFRKLDTDGNGSLTLEEFQAGMKHRRHMKHRGR